MDADNAPNITLRRLGPHDAGRLTAASDLFDAPVTEAGAREFLTKPGHHLLLAETADGRAIGFVSGVETAHPDKGTEMFLYELAVDEGWRRRGVASHLVNALAEIAREAGCYGMWTAADRDNEAALATYRSTGARLEPGTTVVVYDLA
ncbi:ribosomal protein S18 acetylase RimI-like enzyme [Sinomonas atrocyanea]|uniref:GNAT family N-acetyltransferase n=1 Tax=Sinomonas atrocyanea TaxID=37927 RepID=UPI00277F4436|nr:GNAT family N-acetyltransferase [Sinomonas atrocyanea]MDP9884299.1 ribosomal protein S18 acetylase RimI-like enzyme [Sinomonas atrocyanea]